MKTGTNIFTNTIVLIGIGLAFAIFMVIRPVLAQEETSAPADNASTSTVTAPSEPSSTPADTTAAELVSSDSSAAQTDAATSPTSDNAASVLETTAEQPPAGLTQVHIVGTKYI